VCVWGCVGRVWVCECVCVCVCGVCEAVYGFVGVFRCVGCVGCGFVGVWGVWDVGCVWLYGRVDHVDVCVWVCWSQGVGVGCVPARAFVWGWCVGACWIRNSCLGGFLVCPCACPLARCAGELIFIRGTSQSRATTILLRGANEFMLDEMDRSLHDVLCVVKRVLESKSLVRRPSLQLRLPALCRLNPLSLFLPLP
jgi:hypothetical protein